MLGVTVFGLFLTPVFYVLLRKLAPKKHLPTAHAAPLKPRAPKGDDHA
jgi:multidrug efflux pump